jgi:hypothetical protein
MLKELQISKRYTDIKNPTKCHFRLNFPHNKHTKDLTVAACIILEL